MRKLVTLTAAVSAAGLIGLTGLAPASAHVTVSGQNAVPGGYATLTFKVPNEEADASTVGLTVVMPTDAPIASVSVLPVPGWTYTEKTGKPATPLSTDDGPVDEVVTSITWTAGAAAGIKAGEFGQFVISAGPLPDKAGVLHFSALQKYSNGQTVSWTEIAAAGSTAEPDHPAPALTVAATAPAAAPAKNDSSAARSPSNAVPVTLSIIALVLAAGALAVGLLNRRGRRTA